MVSVYMSRLFLLIEKIMIGPRAKILLLTSFFTFTFAIMFFALVQVYAGTTPLPLASETNTDVQSPVEHEIVPNFGVKNVGFDFDSDDSFQKYLATDHPFNDSSYIPTDLIPIDSNFTANNSKAFKLRQEASIQFADMAWHFRNAFSGDRLFISSAYRSRGLQDYIVKQWCALIKCAAAGTSEHQAGLAVDIKVVTKWGRGYSLDAAYPNKYSDWLKAHAAEFGFHNTYQKWVEIDGKVIEWRHRRYLWITLATLLTKNQQTLAEYYKWVEN